MGNSWPDHFGISTLMGSVCEDDVYSGVAVATALVDFSGIDSKYLVTFGACCSNFVGDCNRVCHISVDRLGAFGWYSVFITSTTFNLSDCN